MLERCHHYPSQLSLGRGQAHDITGPVAVTVECECGARWDASRLKPIMSRQELEKGIASEVSD